MHTERMGGEDLESRGRGVKSRANSSYPSSSYVVDDTETQWTSWLVPMFVVANIAMFIVVMFVNNCPHHQNSGFQLQHKCVARFLGRFSFQPLRENPLFGPSSST